MKLDNQSGFSLVEVMIAIVIIGLLTGMAVPAYNKIRASSQERAIINNLRQLASGADQYFIENGSSRVQTAQIIGTVGGRYVKPFKKVVGEVYPLTIYSSSTSLSASSEVMTVSIFY